MIISKTNEVQMKIVNVAPESRKDFRMFKGMYFVLTQSTRTFVPTYADDS